MWSVGMAGFRTAAESDGSNRREKCEADRDCAQAWPERKWGLLLPGAPEPRLPLLRRQDFRSVFQTALRGLSNRSIVVVGNYESGPITAEPCRAKARPLRPRRSCFAPAETRRVAGLGWRRRVLPPRPNGLLRRPFIAIAG